MSTVGSPPPPTRGNLEGGLADLGKMAAVWFAGQCLPTKCDFYVTWPVLGRRKATGAAGGG